MSAFPFVLFGSPISILLRPHPYCLVLPFSMLTFVFYSFPPSFSLLFPFVPLFLLTSLYPPSAKKSTFLTMWGTKIPHICIKNTQFCYIPSFFHEKLLAFQISGINFAPTLRNNEMWLSDPLVIPIIQPRCRFVQAPRLSDTNLAGCEDDRRW